MTTLTTTATGGTAVRDDASSLDEFSALFAAHYRRVVAYCRRRLGDLDEAEDAAADVFRLAWEKSDGGVPTPAWLFGTARFVVLNRRRTATRSARLHHQVAEAIGRATTPDAAGRRLLDALDTLPEDQRELLMCRYWDGLTAPEMAAVFGCAPASVWSRLYRARAALRRAYHRLENP
jgi:RNA polymerase sigma-70 factor (ECF subfamily)